MRGVFLVSLLAIVAPALAPAQVSQHVRGASDHFGPGFTALSEARVDFRLLRPGHAVLFWVTPAGAIDLFYPVRSRDKTLRRAGDNAISVTEVHSPIESPVITGAPVSGRAGQFTPTGGLLTGRPSAAADDEATGYWVLFVTDAPITAPEIQTRLRPMPRTGGANAIIERIAPLLGSEGIPWALYVAPILLR